jgi:Fungal chitosanase of glycosyl hydrolase group 75
MPNIPLPLRNPDGSYTTPRAGMTIDADGANGQTAGVPVYTPEGFTPAPLDFLANAGGPGNWFGVVTDTGEKDGTPVKQTASGPAPGAFVSATSYRWPELARIDPLAYVDAASVPYIVLPSHWRKLAVGVVLGCKATVEDTKTGKILKAAGVLDFGPRTKLGEASIACAEFFGVPSSPKHGGTSEKRFIYTFFPGIPAVIKGVTYQLQPM